MAAGIANWEAGSLVWVGSALPQLRRTVTPKVWSQRGNIHLHHDSLLMQPAWIDQLLMKRNEENLEACWNDTPLVIGIGLIKMDFAYDFLCELNVEQDHDHLSVIIIVIHFFVSIWQEFQYRYWMLRSVSQVCALIMLFTRVHSELVS